MSWQPDIARLQARDDEEWCQVEEHFAGRLLAYAQRRTGGDVQAAEDVLQETMLGAVRGIANFNKAYTFEQYLFGIVRNRSIDYLRRRKLRTLMGDEERDEFPDLDAFVDQTDTPSAIIRGEELTDRAGELFVDILRAWVGETWEAREFQRLAVLEALFAGGWRNRDVWRHFELRDETAVAGIKFRAIKRLQALAATMGSGNELLRYLASAEDGGGRMLDMDVGAIWAQHRVSCPPRKDLEVFLAGGLEGAGVFLGFHLVQRGCENCRANLDDISGDPKAMDALIESL